MRYLASLHNRDLSNEIALVRVDFNIEDEELRELRRMKKIPLRIQAIIPTIQFLRERGARVVLLSHRGRPHQHPDPHATPGKEIKKPTLRPFVAILTALLRERVGFFAFDAAFLKHPNFALLRTTIISPKSPGIFLLGNLRFFKGEERNDNNFARALAGLGTMYVNDAFAVSHRANASVCAITRYVPSYAGMLLEREITNLSRVMRAPKKPLVLILGGGKVHDKIEVIQYFYKKADHFLTGGGIANTLLAAQGLPVGDSLYDSNADTGAFAADLRNRTRKIMIPEDFIIHNRAILDIGPNTALRYCAHIAKAKTIIWNGPMGYIEDTRFAKGTRALIDAIVKSGAFAIIGGGETTGAFQERVRAKRFLSRGTQIFLSTGGGAMLEYLAGKKLPGIEALRTRYHGKKLNT